jgi:phosphatidylglycerophosphate synthase
MSAPPRVVIVLDPRPDSLPADRLVLPGGESLLALVTARATAEAGRSCGPRAAGPDLAALLAELFAAEGGGALCLIDGSALALTTTYGDLVADPRPEPALLQEPDGSVVGVRLDGPPGPGGQLAAAVAETLVAAVREALPGQSLAALGHALLVTSTAAGVPVRSVRPERFPLALVTDDGSLVAALAAEAAVDEPALRLRRASRADDGFLSTFLVRPLSRRVTRRAVAHGVRPDVITLGSGVLGLLAAGAYALARTGPALPWLVAGSLLLLGSLVVDCVDGEVARYTRTFSSLGGWLDVGSDRLKEYAVYAGLAVGARPTAWGLAAAAFAILVVRHFVDFGYAATVSAIGADRSPGGGDPVAAMSERTSARPALLWAKRAVIMPVGERTIVLAVLAPIVGPRWTLWVLLVTGCIAAAYTLVGRLGRMLARPGGLSARLGWLVPALARVVEPGGLVLLVGLTRPAALPGAYLLLAAVAFHQYDVVYRRRLTGAGPDRARTWLDLVPWPVRVVVIAALTLLLGAGPLGWVLTALGVVFGLAAVADSTAWWRTFVRSGL